MLRYRLLWQWERGSSRECHFSYSPRPRIRDHMRIVARISEIPEEVGKLVNLYNFYVNDNKVSDIWSAGQTCFNSRLWEIQYQRTDPCFL